MRNLAAYIDPRIVGAWLIMVGVTCDVLLADALRRYEFVEPHMGVMFQLTFYAADEAAASDAARAAFARIKVLDKRLSDYDPQSELNRLSRTAGSGRSVRAGQELWTVLQRAQSLAGQTGGAFDVTVGPYVRLWRQARRQHVLPPADKLQRAAAVVGFQYMQLDAATHTVRLMKQDMRLDLGGIAKGYAADEALRVLAERGIDRALVDVGGDLVAGRPPPGRKGWRIGVAPLDADAPPSRHYLVSQSAVATSGDAYQFVEIDSVRYSHLINPHTGVGLTTRSSVTVFAPDGITADSLASAVSVLGPRRGLRLIDETCGTAALVVRIEEDRPVVYQSRRLEQLVRIDEEEKED